MKYTFDDIEVDIKVIRKNNKNIYFRFKDYDLLEVTCHYLVSDNEVKRLIDRNYDSLCKMYHKVVKRIKNKEVFTLLGRPYPIIINDSLKDVVMETDYIETPSREKLDKFLRILMKDVFTTELNKYKKIMPDLPEFSLRIRKMTTRWGVCNRSLKVITLNADLIYYDRTLIDYVVVHELCHFYEGNHSKKFWEQVSKYYPNYKEARKTLREH